MPGRRLREELEGDYPKNRFRMGVPWELHHTRWRCLADSYGRAAREALEMKARLDGRCFGVIRVPSFVAAARNNPIYDSTTTKRTSRFLGPSGISSGLEGDIQVDKHRTVIAVHHPVVAHPRTDFACDGRPR